MSDKEYEKEGKLELIAMGILKNTKSSTHFLDGPMFLDMRIADLVSTTVTLLKTLPALVAPKGAQ